MSIINFISRLEEQDIHIQLVDNQLDVDAPKGKLTPALLKEIKNYKSQLIEFIQKNRQSRIKYSPILPTELMEYYILSSAQKRLYILQQIETGHVSYNMPVVFLFEGELDKEKLELVFKKLISRHDSLRTSFQVINDEPVQKIHKQVEFQIQYHDLEPIVQSVRRNDSKDQPALDTIKCESIIKKFIRPFDLSRAPLLRVGMIKIGKKQYMIMFDMHHIITDGISQNILIREFLSLIVGQDFPPLRIQYKDYSKWQADNKKKETIKKQEEYWLKEFEDDIPVLDITTDFLRPAVQSFEGGEKEFKLNERETKALNEMARAEEVTLFMALLTVYNIFLSKLSQQEDIVVGTPIAGRRHVDLVNIIGMFVNILAIRSRPFKEKPFTTFLGEVKENMLKAFENQDYPFEELVEGASVERDASRNPIFDAVFAMQNIFEIPGRLPGEAVDVFKVKPYHYENKTTKFDLTLMVFERGDSLHFSFQYCSKLFKEETILRFINYFRTILSVIIENPGEIISDIEILDEKEKKQILYDFNDTNTSYPKDKRIHELFEKQAARVPGSLALVGPGYTYKHQDIRGGIKEYQEHQEISITYKELDEQAIQLADSLKEKGIQADTIVGIMAARSLEMIIGFLGILKAGGAYLPLDPDYPEARQEYMLRDSNVSILLKDRTVGETKSKIRVSKYQTRTDEQNLKGQNKAAACRALYIEHLNIEGCSRPPGTGLPGNFRPVNLAYVIYTSGTTGKPKGVMINHQSLVNLSYWHNNFFNITGKDHASQYASPGFDASVWEIFPYIIMGAVLYIVSDVIKTDIQGLIEYYERHNITVTFLPTQIYELFSVKDNQCSSLRLLLTGGDKLHLFREKGYQVYNNYGPTENTVVATTFPVNKHYDNIPIGKPICNQRIYILSPGGLQLQPIGIGGELCVGGDGTARGYLNHPELTAEKFDHDLWDYHDKKKSNHTIKNYNKKINKTLLRGVQGGGFLEKSPPGRQRQKIYKTGDLVRWLPGGNIEFLGRIDRQLKIRGFRIELEEIESKLVKHNGIKDAVVLASKNQAGERHLCAYIVPSSTHDIHISELKEYLSSYLPTYMVPVYFVKLEEIPLTPNGKVDRKALPSPKPGEDNVLIPPVDDVEKKLLVIWSQVLGLEKDRISTDSDFFALGGHSLNATIMHAKIHKEFNINISLAEIFKAPTIKRIADLIKVIDWAEGEIEVESNTTQKNKEIIL